MFLLGLALVIMNAGMLLDRYDEWEVADGIISDIWGRTEVTFLESLDVYDERGVFWATIIGAIMILCGLIGAQSTGDEWICAACGKRNVAQVCRHCGTTKYQSKKQWEESSRMQDGIECPVCGRINKRQLDNGQKTMFCVGCGAKLE